MRVYQAHISQNKLEIAHLQLDLDWCNRRLLRIMGVAGSRKGKGSRSSAVLKCCWNLLESVGCVLYWNLGICCTESAEALWISLLCGCALCQHPRWSLGFHRFPPPNQARLGARHRSALEGAEERRKELQTSQRPSFIALPVGVAMTYPLVEGSLEVKLPTIWTVEKQRWKESEEKRSEERRGRCAKR